MTDILVVDDNKDIRYTIKTSLESIDGSYKVEEATSGEDCIKKLSEKKPDIILMDVMMPGMDGMETTIKIKENPDYKDIKIIYLTAKTDSLTKGMGALSGEDFIEKPFVPEDLDKRIKGALKK
ncbi:MAG: response regulator [bacterium]